MITAQQVVSWSNKVCSIAAGIAWATLVQWAEDLNPDRFSLSLFAGRLFSRQISSFRSLYYVELVIGACKNDH